MNQIILVGRLVNEPQEVETKNNIKKGIITIAVNRPFKNSEGIYETDFIRCVLWKGIAENTIEYCHAGDVIGIKGRLQTRSYEDKDGNNKITMEVIAEKVSFLSSARREEEQHD